MSGKTKAAAAVHDIHERLRITRIVCSKTVGDVCVEWTGSLIEGGADSETSALSVGDAKLATYLLGMQVDTLAHERAVANGTMRPDFALKAIAEIEREYATCILRHVGEIPK